MFVKTNLFARMFAQELSPPFQTHFILLMFISLSALFLCHILFPPLFSNFPHCLFDLFRQEYSFLYKILTEYTRVCLSVPHLLYFILCEDPVKPTHLRNIWDCFCRFDVLFVFFIIGYFICCIWSFQHLINSPQS